MDAAEIEIKGFCDPKFERVLEAFKTNFKEHDEIGADLSLIVGGETVIDIRAGWRDVARTKPWEEDTLAAVWSSTKGVAAICFAMAVDRGLARYEDKVSQYWPEFGVAGKDGVTIGMLLSHQAGLSGFLDPITIEEILVGDEAAQRLVAQAPLWEVGSGAGYHATTWGLLVTALLKRITGRSMKQFVAEELEQAFGLDVQIGLRSEDEGRVAEMHQPPTASLNIDPSDKIRWFTLNNPALSGKLSNDPVWREADLPSANGFANGRALARLYALLLRPRSDGKALLGRAAVKQASSGWFEGFDRVKGRDQRWGAGFWLNPGELYGPNLEAFGHSGWGGSFGFADPVADVAVGYTMNRMGHLFDLDPRRRNLIDTTYACL